MNNVKLAFSILSVALTALAAFAQEMKYAPIRDYMMPRAKEISLAKSAAPTSISVSLTRHLITVCGENLDCRAIQCRRF